jgi:ureidoacrylate peracid hydrolase
MVNDFCAAGGSMVLPGAESLYPSQIMVLAAARNSGAKVVYVNDNHRLGMRVDREFVKRSPHCIENSWGSKIVDRLAPTQNDLRVVKRRYSGFFQTDLDLTLRDLQIESLVVMGVVTNICVRSTVHDAFFLGYKVVVPQDCVAATGPREQASSLYDIGTHFGWVSTSSQIIEAFQVGKPIRNCYD